jgi:hypothetical protein
MGVDISPAIRPFGAQLLRGDFQTLLERQDNWNMIV